MDSRGQPRPVFSGRAAGNDARGRRRMAWGKLISPWSAVRIHPLAPHSPEKTAPLHGRVKGRRAICGPASLEKWPNAAELGRASRPPARARWHPRAWHRHSGRPMCPGRRVPSRDIAASMAQDSAPVQARQQDRPARATAAAPPRHEAAIYRSTTTLIAQLAGMNPLTNHSMSQGSIKIFINP